MPIEKPVPPLPLWMAIRVEAPDRRSRLRRWLEAKLRPPMTTHRSPNPTAQWLDQLRKTEGVDGSPEWLSWIEVSSVYARAGITIDTEGVRVFDRRRKGHDGHWRYPRDAVLAALEATKARKVEEALDE